MSEEKIKKRAHELGFELAGITSAQPIEKTHINHFEQWLNRNFCGPLEYMTKNLDKRTHPGVLLPDARSVICVGLRYEPLSNRHPDTKIASYALYEEYHPFIKTRLHQLAAYIESLLPRSADWKFKAAVDSAPLAEKTLARRAGLGFIGRNHILTHPKYGGCILLGELITTLDLAPDQPLDTAHCGSCDRCIRACPTGALRPDGFLDARLCLSCRTQYNSPNSHPADGRWLYGCDECLLACPYTQNAPPIVNSQFSPFPLPENLGARQILEWTQDTFDRTFAGSCIHRIGLQKIRENAENCLKYGKQE